jgi:hypothetical protein
MALGTAEVPVLRLRYAFWLADFVCLCLFAPFFGRVSYMIKSKK